MKDDNTMKHQHLISSTLLVGFLAVTGSAMAQNPNPVKPAEGAPAARESVRAEARANNKSPANTMTPNGEASTRVNNQPNATPSPVSDTTRAEVRQDAMKTKP